MPHEKVFTSILKKSQRGKGIDAYLSKLETANFCTHSLLDPLDVLEIAYPSLADCYRPQKTDQGQDVIVDVSAGGKDC